MSWRHSAVPVRHHSFIVRSTPAWAQQVAGCRAARSSLQPLMRLLALCMIWSARYSVPPYNVHMWEIGNEPDVGSICGGDSEFGCWGNPADAYYGGGAYGEMLKRVYPGIKQA